LPAARTLAEELLKANPKNLVVLRIAADVAQKQDRVMDASQLLERAIEIDPASKELRYPLVRLYLNNSELDGLDKSVGILSDYLAKYEQDAEAYLLLGNVYRKKEDASNARQNFQTGIDKLKLTPPIPPRLSWAYTAYGILLYNEKDYERAYTILTEARGLAPDDETILYNYGLTCVEMDRKEQLDDVRQKLDTLNSPRLADLDKAIKSHGTKKR
jgi:tetratricopeptide (TPR) repeat protein